MKYPKWLTDANARKFWHDHAPHLIETGKLTEQNADKFAQMCEVWGAIRTADKTKNHYVNLNKLFNTMSREFDTDKNQAESLQDIMANIMKDDE